MTYHAAARAAVDVSLRNIRFCCVNSKLKGSDAAYINAEYAPTSGDATAETQTAARTTNAAANFMLEKGHWQERCRCSAYVMVLAAHCMSAFCTRHGEPLVRTRNSAIRSTEHRWC
jgi:hypothetical protein